MDEVASSRFHGGQISRGLNAVIGWFRASSWSLRITLILVIGWTTVISRLLWLKHARFSTFAFDLGIHDQSIWLLAHGKSFVTVRGLPVLGHHAVFGLYLLAPFSWIGAGPEFWNILHTLALASCAIPLHFLARRRGCSSATALIVSAVWLLQPTISWLANESFHPEVIAMPFLAFAYLFLVPGPGAVVPDYSTDNAARREVRLGIAMLVCAIIWKEDVALAVAMIGILVAIRRSRRLGAKIFLFGLGWFILVGMILIAQFAGGVHYNSLYSNLGDNGLEILGSLVLHPLQTIEILIKNDAAKYFAGLVAPVGFTAVFSPLTLLVALPQLVANIFTTANFTYSLKYHYQAIPILVASIAMVETISRSRRTVKNFEFLPALVLVVALISARGWGITPLGETYRDGNWPLIESADSQGWRAAIERVGPTSGVSAHYLVVPHLSRRTTIYNFPNPWINHYYGTNNNALGNPEDVDWIVVKRSALDVDSKNLLDQLLLAGQFGDENLVGDIATYRRLKQAGE
jgi:uncharacterized membrane protein